MISSSKRRIIILVTIGILFALLPLIFSNLSYLMGNAILDSNSSENRNLDYENLKISKISGKIHIDNNWTAAKSAGICIGDGTYSDPYVIEDLIIDGGGVGSCILIENSDVYFRIENCTTYNSWWYYGAGIHLSYVRNSQLINNNCSSNSNGIYVYRSENNTILGNDAKKNTNGGIFLRFSDRNEVSGNTVNYNKNGIIILVSDYNIILGNTGNYNEEGLCLFSSNSNTISGNTVDNNWKGISLSECNENNIIAGNIANNNLIGIYLDDNDVTTISGNVMNGCGLWIDGDLESMLSNEVDTANLVNGKPLYYYTLETHLGVNDLLNAGQVILVKCHNLLISNVNVSYSSTGIALHYCINNTISGNTVNNNDKGIYLTKCERNEISGNTVAYNEEGIFLTGSDYNNISGNTAGNNSKGIELFYSTGNRIFQNIIMGNHIGIHSWVFDHESKKYPNEIFNNTFSDNGVDILIYPDPHGDGGDPLFLYLMIGLVVLVFIAIAIYVNYASNKLGKKKFKS